MTKYRSVLRTILISALATCTGIANEAAATSPAYTVTDLGTLNGISSEGRGINASGQVAGYSGAAPFLWTPTTPNGADGTLHPLIGGYALEINSVGQVTGQGGPSGSFLWTPTTPNGASGTLADLGTLGGTYGLGLGINDSGQVTGQSSTSGDAAYRPYLWTPTTPNGASGTIVDLGTLGGTLGSGNDINNIGQVTGQSSLTGNAEHHAILWIPTTPGGASGTLHDLGTLGGTVSEALGINASGQVAGRSYTIGDTESHAILWTPTTPNGASGTMIDLGTLPGGTYSLGWDINADGQVTGMSHSGTTGEHAFLYTPGSGMVDLNTLIDPLSGWVLRTGYGINDAGQITGYGHIGGKQHAFLLTPVPEPATWMMLCLGLVAVSFRRAAGR